MIEPISSKKPAPTLDDALGLIPDPGMRTKPIPPEIKQRLARTPSRLSCLDALKQLTAHEHPALPEVGRSILPPTFISEAAYALVDSLDAFINDHFEETFETRDWYGNLWTETLGSGDPAFPTFDPKQGTPIPRQDLWIAWWDQYPTPVDSTLLVQALAIVMDKQHLLGMYHPVWIRDISHLIWGSKVRNNIRFDQIIISVLSWFISQHPSAITIDFLLDASETIFALVPESELIPAKSPIYQYAIWRNYPQPNLWLMVAQRYCILCPSAWTVDQHRRFWGLRRWLDEPSPNIRRFRPTLEEILSAFQAGVATDADMYDQLLGPRDQAQFQELSQLTSPDSDFTPDKYPGLDALLNRCKERIVALELIRGETPTVATDAARHLQSSGGLTTLITLLQALGTSHLMTATARANRQTDKPAILQHLIRVTYPADGDTPAVFAERLQAVRITNEQLLRLALVAPQWAKHVEQVLGWPALTEAIWWFYNHSHQRTLLQFRPYGRTSQHQPLWYTESVPYLSLTPQELDDGAVDLHWFERIHAALGQERWNHLLNVSRYVGLATDHKRVRLLSDALLGRLRQNDVLQRVQRKLKPDLLSALCLLPIHEEADLLTRYEAIQAFAHTAEASQHTLPADSYHAETREETKRLGVHIALVNLARRAGYNDPEHLRWMLETRAATAYQTEPITLDGTTARQQHITALLEQAMCQGNLFTAAEVRQLATIPLLAAIVKQLVFLTEGFPDGAIGYPEAGGTTLRGVDGTLTPINESCRLRIAHPYDLLHTEAWHTWQRECFLAERVQPFKQVFRELYILTELETTDRLLSRRYAGQEVIGEHAWNILTEHAWTKRQNGVQHQFYREGFTAKLNFTQGYMVQAEGEGYIVDSLTFSVRGQDDEIPLHSVPPRVFSETMRDVDLAVSESHQGGIDHEANASTIQRRAALIQETCHLLNVENVSIRGMQAWIQGQLATYTVHLSSAIIHLQPGGSLCIVPVHAQHRGRLILPFSEHDPRTAEIVSKVILLARDHEIKDPTILAQITRRG